ncbi:MAG TPA: 3-hydroxyacyl-CoA dehydrogenase NAD-binding domain-containing protein, partial [Gaiellaceae bacterium]|nr:3-hydroxyacyl-CoA dehydrogenase NAD-binding domain-containing protein [Gaiellaceae bacterium]
MSESIERVGVVGAGLMGAGIAEVAAKAGVDVTVCDINDAAVSAGRSRIEASLKKAVRAGKLEDDAAMAALARVRFVTDIGELADRQLVVEAVREFEDEKLEVFRNLGKIVIDEDAVLASNTSSIPIMKLAVASERPEHVVGLHFFNPVPVMRLVELIPSIITSSDVADRAEDFMV